MTAPKPWPTREEWEVEHRTFYSDMADAVPFHGAVADYASPEQVDVEVARLRELWKTLGRELRTLNTTELRAWEANWRAAQTAYLDRRRACPCHATRPFCQCPDDEWEAAWHLPDHLKEPLARVRELRDQRRCLNEEIKEIRAGRLARYARYSFSSFAAMAHRRRADDIEAHRQQVTTRPIDDAAWAAEIERRARLDEYFAQGPTVRRYSRTGELQ